MNFAGLGGSTAGGNARKLNIIGKSTLQTSNKYLLSDEYIEISILSSGEVDQQKLNFQWGVTKITGTVITIQVEFENPLYISTSANISDRFQVWLKPQSLAYFRSKKYLQPVKNPFKS